MNFITSIKDLDTELFLFFNSKHTASLDFIMYWASNKLVWIPLYIYFFFLVYKKANSRVWLVLISALMLIAISDQLSVHAFKDVFQRYRPCHNLLLQNQIHMNEPCGGMYGFISSHASNTFALAMFLFLFFRNEKKYFGIFIFLWAAFVSYSRIYNGNHYPADVAVGALVGMCVGILIFRTYKLTERKIFVS